MNNVRIALNELMGRKMQESGTPVQLKEVSEGTGISENQLVHMRKGRVAGIKFKTIEALCNYFGCEPGDLFTYQDSKVVDGGGELKS